MPQIIKVTGLSGEKTHYINCCVGGLLNGKNLWQMPNVETE